MLEKYLFCALWCCKKWKFAIINTVPDNNRILSKKFKIKFSYKNYGLNCYCYCEQNHSSKKLELSIIVLSIIWVLFISSTSQFTIHLNSSISFFLIFHLSQLKFLNLVNGVHLVLVLQPVEVELRPGNIFLRQTLQKARQLDYYRSKFPYFKTL